MLSKMATLPVTPERLSPSNADGGSSSRGNSPDGNCPICLGRVNNKAFTDACFHTFCFVCLLEWSKVRPTCPLCKTTFKSIIHNVVSNDIYDQYHLKPTDTGSFGTDGRGRRFRYSTTLTEEHRVEFTLRRNQALERRYRRAHQVHLEAAAIERRRMIYRAGLWVRHMGSNRFTRFRDISPEFFSENPATTHRLVPWLRRELSILFSGEDHVTFMTQYILSLIPNVHMQTEEFHEHLRPFLYGQTEHFIHEFVSFARSPYDMSTYDQIAQYDLAAGREPQPPPQQEPPQPLSRFLSSTEYNNVITLSSDDEVIEIPTLSSLLRSDSASSSSFETHGEQAEALDLSSTHNPEPPRSQQFDQDQAGPSGISSQPLEVKTESRSDQENVISDDSDIEIVGVVKPYEERTPECIVLISSSTEEDQDETVSRREKKGGKRHKKRKHTVEKSHHKKKHSESAQDSSRTAEHSHADKSHRHTHKKKRKDARHRKHSKSSKSSKKEHKEASHRPKEGANSSQSHHRLEKRSHSRSRSKSSSSSHLNWKSSNKDSSVTTEDYSRDRSKEASASSSYSTQSHSSSSSRHKSDQTYHWDARRYDKRHGTEQSASHHETQPAGQTGASWEVRTKSVTDSDSSEHPEASMRHHSHDRYHHKTTLSRKRKSSDSRDHREGYKIRRSTEDADSSLTIVFSRTNSADDRGKSSASSVFTSSHSRHKKHKKHKRHKSDSKKHSGKGKPTTFVPYTHYDVTYMYKNDDAANDGDESSPSTEEEDYTFTYM